MKQELITTTYNGYIIDRKNTIKNTANMSIDDILNEVFGKRWNFAEKKLFIKEFWRNVKRGGKVRNMTVDEKIKFEIILNRANIIRQTDYYENTPGVKELVDDALALEYENAKPMWDMEFNATYDDLEFLMNELYLSEKHEREDKQNLLAKDLLTIGSLLYGNKKDIASLIKEYDSRVKKKQIDECIDLSYKRFVQLENKVISKTKFKQALVKSGLLKSFSVLQSR